MNRRFAGVLAASLLLLLPVLSQEHVQAGDLASHLYNTWLVLLVKQGEPLGLEIVPQYSNVLFDWWLEGLWRLGGPKLAEKGATGAAVLCFFWGAFVLLGRLSGRPAWPSAPLLAMLSYGWVYQQGFFNYYLSCAFGFWALAFALGRGRQRWLALPALLLAALAHLLGAAVAVAFAGYLLLRKRMAPHRQPWLLAAAVLCLALAGATIGALMLTESVAYRFLHLSGATPVLPFPGKYMIPAVLLPILWVTAATWITAKFGSSAWNHPATHVAVLAAAALVLLPAGIQVPGLEFPLLYNDSRLALWYCLALHAWCASHLPPRFTAAFCAAAAATFFVFLTADWRVLGQTEGAVHQAVRRLPRQSRVVSGFVSEPRGLNSLLHMIDRACIGHCYSYANYEPPSTQFRLRARPGTPVGIDSAHHISEYNLGRYVVRERDLPLHALVFRSVNPVALELRPLAAGQRLDLQRISLPPPWFQARCASAAPNSLGRIRATKYRPAAERHTTE